MKLKKKIKNEVKLPLIIATKSLLKKNIPSISLREKKNTFFKLPFIKDSIQVNEKTTFTQNFKE